MNREHDLIADWRGYVVRNHKPYRQGPEDVVTKQGLAYVGRQGVSVAEDLPANCNKTRERPSRHTWEE